MGYACVEGEAIPVEISRRDGPEPHLKRIWSRGATWYCEECGSVPQFCEEMAAAWQVVASFSEGADGQGGYNVELQGHGDGWTFHMFKDGTCYEAMAPTPMLAICRTAIRACLDRAVTDGGPVDVGQ